MREEKLFPVNKVVLSTRLYNTFTKNGFFYLSEFENVSLFELKWMQGFGKKTLENLNKILSEKEIYLKKSPPPQRRRNLTRLRKI